MDNQNLFRGHKNKSRAAARYRWHRLNKKKFASLFKLQTQNITCPGALVNTHIETPGESINSPPGVFITPGPNSPPESFSHSSICFSFPFEPRVESPDSASSRATYRIFPDTLISLSSSLSRSPILESHDLEEEELSTRSPKLESHDFKEEELPLRSLILGSNDLEEEELHSKSLKLESHDLEELQPPFSSASSVELLEEVPYLLPTPRYYFKSGPCQDFESVLMLFPLSSDPLPEGAYSLGPNGFDLEELRFSKAPFPSVPLTR